MIVLNLTHGGLVPYMVGLDIQERIASTRRRGLIPDVLLLLEHLPVITVGRTSISTNLLTNESDLKEAGVQLLSTNRGGDMTYHGPGQLVGYPIVHLGENNRDVRSYVKLLENHVIEACCTLGVPDVHTVGFHAGVWFGRNYIAAIGVRIRQWVTMHGFAINITEAVHSGFKHIVPCGVMSVQIMSLSELSGKSITVQTAADAIISAWTENRTEPIQVLRGDTAIDWIESNCPSNADDPS